MKVPEKIYIQPMLNPSDGYVGVAWSDTYCDAKEYTLTDAFIEKACDKPLTFKAIPRLLSMVKPSRKAKAYCEKLAKSLENEGYLVDAKIVHESIKIMDGEKVPMATMDEEAKQFAEEYSFNIESNLYQTLTGEQRDSWKKEIENAIKVGVSWQTERFENNRVNAFKN